MIHNYNISSEARTNVLLNFAKSQQMKAKDNFLLSSFAFSPVKSYHRNSMILHGRKGETETKCLRIVYANFLLKFYKNQSFDDIFIYLWHLSTHLTQLIGSKCHSYTPIDQIHCQEINLDYLIPIAHSTSLVNFRCSEDTHKFIIKSSIA